MDRTVIFKIKSSKSKLFLWVKIHPDLDKFRKAYKRYDSTDDVTGCYGVCHRYSIVKVNKLGEVIDKKKDVGIIRLSAKHCTTEIIAHELIHGAMQIYREEFDKRAFFGKNIDDREENLAYIYDDLFYHLCRKLYKYQIWK